MRKLRVSRLGHRSESLIVLPAALVILSLLSTFTLFSYRGTVSLLVEERRAEAAGHARRVAQALTSGRLPSERDLGRLAPLARGVAIVDAAGRELVSVGELAEREAALAFEARRLFFSRDRSDVVTGMARLRAPAEGLSVRVDLAAPILGSRAESLRILSLLVLGINASVLILVLFFLRRFLAPIDRMLERARDLGGEGPETQDEVEHLVETFESALEALAKTQEQVELEALGKTFAGSLESGVLLLDRHGTVLALNPVGRKLLDIGEPNPGSPLEEIFAGLPSLAEALAQAVGEGQTVQRRELEVEGVRGETRTLGLSVHPLRREGGQIRGFLGLFADLTTARREAEEERLSDSLTQVGELAAGVAHELRNSLATLRGYLALLERDQEHEARDDYLAEIRRESDHLQRVLEDFLGFARPGSVRRQPVDLLRLAHRVAADPALGGAAVRIVPASDVEDLRTLGDPQLLERAFRNLLHNAVAAQGEIGVEAAVEVRLAASPEGLEVEISDRGPGFPAEQREKLFDPFVSERPGGVGLGLALTRRILLLHGGQVELRDRKGAGASALVRLPADPAGKSVTDGSI